MRKAKLHRKTAETDIQIVLNIDGRGKYEVSTGIRFLDHMLELFTRHGGFDLKLAARGDLDVDQHHTVEDVGIGLGEAFDRALGDRRGIWRAGYFLMTMDETLGLAAVDFGGRAVAVVETKVRAARVGDLQTELVYDFFEGFARGARANVMRARYTGAPAITRLRRCSKLLRARCVWRARATAGWDACYRAPRGFYDRVFYESANDRDRGLRRRQPEFGEEGV